MLLFLSLSTIVTPQQYLISHAQVTRLLIEQKTKMPNVGVDASALYFFAFLTYERKLYDKLLYDKLLNAK